VVSFNTRDSLARCLASLDGLELIVVDNGSIDGSADLVRRDFPRATVIANQDNVGFGRACNQALAVAGTPLVLLINSDATLRPGALASLEGVLLARPGLAVVGPRILGPAGPEPSFGPPPGLLADLRHRSLVRGATVPAPDPGQDPAWVSAACLLGRREALLSVGGFDESFFLYYEDVDLCLRLRQAGFGVAFDPGALVEHRRGTSAALFPGARLEAHRSHLRLYRKHLGLVSVAVLRASYTVRGLGLLPLSATRDLGRALLALGLRGS
jgi:GT2 family glycosyltransferase